MRRGLDLLEEMVLIDSGPGLHEGISAVQDLVGARLSSFGFDVELRASVLGPDVLLAHRHNSAHSARRVLLLGHADTVFPDGTAVQRPFNVEGGFCFGPGVADMKGGLIVMLHAIEYLGEAAVSLSVVVNGDEESGSVHSRPLIEEMAADHEVALIFEPARPGGEFVIARRGVQRYRVLITGRAAHTGVDPQAGANAIEAAAHHTLQLQDLGRSLDDASVIVTLASGGSRPNVVPDSATLTVDCRIDNQEAAEFVFASVARLESDPAPVEGTSTRIESLDARPPMIPTADVAPLCELYQNAAKEAGFEAVPVSTGGSSDGNFTSALGVATLDGLGPVGGGYHTAEEFLDVATLESRSRAAAGLLRRISEAAS